MGKFFFVGIATIISISFASPAKACSCEGEPSVEEAFTHSDAVWAGTVIRKEQVYVSEKGLEKPIFREGELIPEYSENRKIPLFRYVLRVDTWYKGNHVGDTVTVYTGLGGGDCGVRFREGDRYIVYGTRESYLPTRYGKNAVSKSDTIFWTHSCTRTDLYSEKEEAAIRNYLEETEILGIPYIPPVYEKNGNEGMNAFFLERFIYPADAHAEGKVYVKIRVSASGEILSAEIARGITPSIDKEVIRVVKQMEFLPGTLNGEPVEMDLVLPFKISFR